MDALNEISKNSERIADLLGFIDGVTEKKAEELTNLDEAISLNKKTKEQLDQELERIRKRHADEIDRLTEDISNKQKVLEAVEAELEAAKVERDKARKEHNDFVTFKMTADKALKAKEDSLLEREKSLEETVNEIKRRRGILGI